MSAYPAATPVIWRVISKSLFPTDTAPLVLFQVELVSVLCAFVPKSKPTTPLSVSATESEPKATEPSIFVLAPEPNAKESIAFAFASNPIAIARSSFASD